MRIENITQDIKADPIARWSVEHLQEMPSRSERPILWAIWNYNDMLKKHADPVTGKVNYTTFEAEWIAFTSQWDDEEAKESGGLLDRYNNILK